jgi:hypothetical protein
MASRTFFRNAFLMAAALLLVVSVAHAAPNLRTHAVKTYIVGQEGTYRFPGLSTTDYEVYAQYNGHKSDTKSVSQFDDRSQVYIDLRIDVR